MSRPAPLAPALLSRRHVGFAGVTLALAAVGGGSVAVLREAPPLAPPPAHELASLGDTSPGTAAPRVELHDPRVELPAPDALEPQGRAVLGRADLPPLARSWRAAVVSAQRDQVMAGARALRSAPDAREQLLLLSRDEDPRVRAYSLRELGRRQDPSLDAVFRAALADTSPYVVENARWGLDQLQLGEQAGPQPSRAGAGGER